MLKEYLDYINENIDKNISYTEYIAEQIHSQSSRDETRTSKDLLVSIMMEKYEITSQDLKDVSIVKSKLRDTKIDEIIK